MLQKENAFKDNTLWLFHHLEKFWNKIKSNILMAVTMKILISWDMRP